MKTYLLIFFLLLCSMGISQNKSENKKLIWAEEFEEEQINPHTWNFEQGLGKNYESQFYTERKKNSRIENGMLVIEARAEDYKDATYTSARLNTHKKKHFKYGFLEIRAKLPEGKGTWPAIWMLGANHHRVGYPGCGEIDIMEFVGKEPGKVHAAVHYPSPETDRLRGVAGKTSLPFSEDGFHIYSLEWDRHTMAFFVDGIEYQRFNVKEAKFPWKKNIFKKPYYLILNLALGGNWAGEIEDEALPAKFYIDYIRYYK